MRYTALLDHYGMAATRNNRGLGHENGSVESSHRFLKEAIEQALLLRGHRDFYDRAGYDNNFVREVVMRRNRRNAAAFRIERSQLPELCQRRSALRGKHPNAGGQPILHSTYAFSFWSYRGKALDEFTLQFIDFRSMV